MPSYILKEEQWESDVHLGAQEQSLILPSERAHISAASSITVLKREPASSLVHSELHMSCCKTIERMPHIIDSSQSMMGNTGRVLSEPYYVSWQNTLRHSCKASSSPNLCIYLPSSVFKTFCQVLPIALFPPRTRFL
jgi:hypothetical protein